MPLILLILEALGGLGLLILGMKTLSGGLQRLAGGWLRQSLEMLTINRYAAVLTGGFLSYLLQSSSTASILVIGSLNAGLISLYQALGVLLGTAIGTTIAVQLFAFKITFFALPTIFVGVMLKFFGSSRRAVYAGEVLLGIGLLFLGLKIMEADFAPITQNTILLSHQLHVSFWHISFVLLGALLTFLTQSGYAALGIIIAMASGGFLDFEAGTAMMVGEGIGIAWITAIASIGGTLAAKRAALIYFLITILAVTVVLLAFPLFALAVRSISPGAAPSISRQLANAHTLFWLLNLLIFLPLLGFFTRSASKLFPGRAGRVDIEPRTKYIDIRVINTPSIAFLQVRNELQRMAEVAHSMYGDMVELFYRYDAHRAGLIKQKEEVLDVLQRDIANFLVALSRPPLAADIAVEIPYMINIINDLEQFGDQAEAILVYLQRKKEENIYFSDVAMDELKTMAAQVAEIVALAVQTCVEVSEDSMEKGVLLKESCNQLYRVMKKNHVNRLRSGNCTVVAGLVYGDILTAFSKIGENSFNIIEAEWGLH